MSWVSNLLNSNQISHLSPDNRGGGLYVKAKRYGNGSVAITGGKKREEYTEPMDEEEEATRAPYWHCMVAGGIGGTSGDLLMHSIDTVKTRQQGDPHMPPRYGSLTSAYRKIFRQEGLKRGLYSGVTPAFLGSFPGTIIFFGTYEYSKRHMLAAGVNPTLAYLAGGFIADFAASFVYVPSEVLKTRLQLQGRYNNPFFSSGYNYRSTIDAARTIIRQEGFSALFYGYKATIFRDLPFSAIQFALYEQEQKWARQWSGSRDIGLGLEVATAASAGGMAGVVTCPLDVVKTRIQTQVNPPEAVTTKSAIQRKPNKSTVARDTKQGRPSQGLQPLQALQQRRRISTSSPNTSLHRSDAVKLDTESVMRGLRVIYRTEGMMGLFRGVGPRFVWTSVQSGTMLVLYQTLLRQLAIRSLLADKECGDV